MGYEPDVDVEGLLSDSEIPRIETRKATHALSRLQAYCWTVGLVLIVLQLLTLSSTFRNRPIPWINSTRKVWKDCGNSASEALDRGCVYDVMMTGWVKKDCYNKTLSDQFLSEGNFTFYSDSQATNEITLDTMRLGQHTHMWTNDLHHRAHCVYVWKLQALALESQATGIIKLIDSESYTLDHTEHCSKILVKSIPSPPYSMNYCEVDFLSCGPYLS